MSGLVKTAASRLAVQRPSPSAASMPQTRPSSPVATTTPSETATPFTSREAAKNQTRVPVVRSMA